MMVAAPVTVKVGEKLVVAVDWWPEKEAMADGYRDKSQVCRGDERELAICFLDGDYDKVVGVAPSDEEVVQDKTEQEKKRRGRENYAKK